MLNRFENWCQGLEPEWVGGAIFVSTMCTLILFLASVILVVVFHTSVWVIPIATTIFLAYVWYVALFRQP
jgi:hypothetical protein